MLTRSQATCAGLARARAAGKQLGRPQRRAHDADIHKAIAAGEALTRIAARLHVHMRVVRRVRDQILRTQPEPDDGLQAQARMQQRRGER